MKIYNYTIKREFVRDVESDTVVCPEQAVIAAKEAIDFDREQEQVVVLAINNANNVMGSFVATIGSIDASIVHPRDIFKFAILSNATGIIVVHNHPSGILSPSKADVSIMIRLVECGQLMGIPILDSLIVTEDSYLSMKEKGYI